MWNQAAIYRRRRRRFGISAALVVLLLIIVIASSGGGKPAAKPASSVTVVAPSAVPLSYSAATVLPAAIRESAAAPDPQDRGSFSLIGGTDSTVEPLAATAGIATVNTGGGTLVGDLPVSLYAEAAVELDGHEYIFGGDDGTDAQPYIYDYDIGGKGQVNQVGELPQSDYGLGAAVAAHTVYLVGGYNGTTALTTIDSWAGPGHPVKKVAMLPEGLQFPAVAAVDGELVIAGGLTASGQASKQVFIFTPANKQVRLLTLLPVGLYAASAATLGRLVYFIGGMQTSTTPVSTIYSIDPSSKVVGYAGSLPSPRAETAAITLGNTIYLAGGWNGSAVLNYVSQLSAAAPKVKAR
jgi:hypothetical protein